MRVFVSSTKDDLVDHRQAVAERLQEMGQIAGRMEVFGARPTSPLETSLAEVASSHLFVGIYAHHYGSIAESNISFTEREYDEAVRRGKPVLAFIVDDDFDWKVRFVDGEPGRTRLADLKARLRREHTVATFGSPDDLALKVEAGVNDVLMRGEFSEIPAPAATDPVGIANIALLHTSFFRSDKTKERDDGRRYYQFEVVVIARHAVMQRIRSVTYRMQDEWPLDKRVQVTSDRTSRFKMKELANGTSIVRAEIDIDGQAEPVRLNRFIDLHEAGPRL